MTKEEQFKKAEKISRILHKIGFDCGTEMTCKKCGVFSAVRSQFLPKYCPICGKYIEGSTEFEAEGKEFSNRPTFDEYMSELKS